MHVTRQSSRILVGHSSSDQISSYYQRKPRRCRVINSIPQLALLFAAMLCLSSLFHLSEAFSTTFSPKTTSQPRQRHRSNSNTLFDVEVDPSFISLSERSAHLHNSSKRWHSFKSSSTSLSVTKRKPMPIVGYNGQEICDYYDRSPLEVGWRLNILSLPLLGKFTNH